MSELFPFIVIVGLGLVLLVSVFKLIRKNTLKSYVESIFYNAPDVILESDSYKDYYRNTKDDFHIDDTTWNDLDMQDVYMAINHSLSSVGDEFLYALLRDQKTIVTDDLSERLLNDHALRSRVQVALGTLGRRVDNGLADQLYSMSAEVPTQFRFLPFQRILALLPFVIVFFNPVVAIFIFVFAFIFNIGMFMMLSKEITKRLRTLNYFVDLLKCARTLNKDIEIKGLEPFKGLKSYIGSMSISLNEGSGFVGMVVIVNAYFTLYGFSFVKILNAINTHTVQARSVFQEVGRVEIALSRASLMSRVEVYCEPIYTDVLAPIVEDLVHPLIKDPVGNSHNLSKNTLVTGSNASGKSTFVRSLAINVILGQRLNFCFAKSMEFRPCFVASSMAISDDVKSGDSYFVAEIKSLKRLIQASEKHKYSFLIIDEILKGTNTIERIAASASILNELKNRDCFICAATHDIELVNILSSSFDKIHFREIIDEKGIHFDYKLQMGPSNTRNAIKLLEHYGYDQKLIDRANRLADDFGTSMQWDMLI